MGAKNRKEELVLEGLSEKPGSSSRGKDSLALMLVWEGTLVDSLICILGSPCLF